MKKLKNRALALCLIFAMLASMISAFAVVGDEVIASGECGAQGGNITWELNAEGILTLTGSGQMKDFFSAGGPWIKYKENILTLQMDDEIVSIGSNAFSGCTPLSSAKLSASLTLIKYNAFKDCSSLTYMELPAGLTTIEHDAFRGCSSLALTKLPEGLTSIGNYAFYGCSSLALTSLPEGITTIKNGTFHGCSSLALTELPEGLTSIEEYAFYGCSSLALIKLPEGLTAIGGTYTFLGCSSLALTELPAGLTSIGYGAFYGCSSLALTELPEGLTSIERQAFCDCSSLALTKLPEGLTSIGTDTFRGCSSLALTELPEGLISIGDYAFYGCSSMTLTELPPEITANNIGRFTAFVNNLQYVDANAPAQIERMKAALDNPIWWQWCDSLILCQADHTLRDTLIPIVGKFSDLRIQQEENATKMMLPLQRAGIMVALTVCVPLILYFSNAAWANNLLYTTFGQISLVTTAIVSLISVNAAIKLSRPIQYNV